MSVTPIGQTGTVSTGRPPLEVIEAFEAGIVRHTRRVAIYESDGATLWNPTINEVDFARLVSGTVTVDYNSSERRTLDLVLDNQDLLLRPNPDDGFWYDKIIKVFRGVQFDGKAISPQTAIIEQPSEIDGIFLRTALSGNGFDKTVVLADADSSADLQNYSFIISYTGSAATTKSTLLKEMWNAGKHIVTIGVGSSHTQIPIYSSASSPTNLATNGGAESTVVGWASNSGALYPVSHTTVSPITGAGSALTVRTSSTPSTNAASIYANGVGAISDLKVAPGATLHGAVTVRPARAQRRVQAYLRFRDSAGTVLASSPTVTMPTTTQANETVRITVPGYVAPAGTDHAYLVIGVLAMDGNAVTGEEVRYDDLYLGLESDAVSWGIASAPGDHPGRGAFTPEAAGTAPGTRPTATVPGAVRVAVWPDAVSPTHITAAIGVSPAGGYWFDLHLPNVAGPQSRNLLRAVMNFMRNYYSDLHWEVQQGEFMIDTISADHFPDQIKVTGRDYTKKLMLSKLENTTTFAAGTSLAALVRALATNGGADSTKFNIAIGDETLASDMAYDRGTDRWSIIAEACESYGYEVFFNAYGAFTVRKYVDPSTAPVMWTFKTGYEEDPEGANLVDYSRSSNDSRIYNHVVVYSDPADGEERLPYFGEAKNEDPGSPTRIGRIGDRMLPIVTNWLKSDAECVALAESRLKISALESYDLSFSSIFYPWLEVGEIAEILDPDRLGHEPTRFLIDNLQYPLDLGPMQGNGRRVTFVGSSGSPDTLPEEG